MTIARRIAEIIRCPRCGKPFATVNAAHQHFTAKHDGVWHAPQKRQHQLDEPEEETIADRAVQAEIDRACGVDNPDIDWLLP